jgi:hypothetical protein
LSKTHYRANLHLNESTPAQGYTMIDPNTYRLIGLFVASHMLIALFFGGLTGCSKTPIEEQLATNTREIATHVEALDANGLLKWLHVDFQTSNGQDRQSLKQLMMLYRLRNQQVGVTLANLTITPDPHYLDQAEVTVHAALTSTISNRFLPEQGQVYQLRLKWREESGDWKITHAEWKKLL